MDPQNHNANKSLIVSQSVCFFVWLVATSGPVAAYDSNVSGRPNDKRPASAFTAEGSAFRIDPKLQSLVKAGSTALGKDQYDLAISRFTAALQMNRDKNTAAYIYYLRAQAYVGKEQLDKAINDTNEAIRLFPQFPGGYLIRGIAYRHLGQQDKAISDYDTAIRLNPYSTIAYNNRAIAYGEKGQHEQAIHDFDEAIRRNPNFADAYLNRGFGYELAGKWDKALADYSEAIRLNPTVPRGHLSRGNLYYKAGKYREAAADIAVALKKTPTNKDALAVSAWLKATCPDVSLRNGREAVRQSLTACKLTNWKDVDSVNALAAACAEVGDFDQAAKYQEQAMTIKGAPADSRQRMEQRLRLYREHKPFRVEPKKLQS